MLGVLPLAPGEVAHAVFPAVPDSKYFLNEGVREESRVAKAHRCHHLCPCHIEGIQKISEGEDGDP